MRQRKVHYFKAAFYSTVFDIPMRLVDEEQRHR